MQLLPNSSSQKMHSWNFCYNQKLRQWGDRWPSCRFAATSAFDDESPRFQRAVYGCKRQDNREKWGDEWDEWSTVITQVMKCWYLSVKSTSWVLGKLSRFVFQSFALNHRVKGISKAITTGFGFWFLCPEMFRGSSQASLFLLLGMASRVAPCWGPETFWCGALSIWYGALRMDLQGCLGDISRSSQISTTGWYFSVKMAHEKKPDTWLWSLWLKTGDRSRCCVWVGYHVGGATNAVVWLQFQLHLKIEHCWLTNIPFTRIFSCSCSTSRLADWYRPNILYHFFMFFLERLAACLASWSSISWISWGGIMKKSMTLMRMVGDSTKPFPGRDDHMGRL